MKYTNLPAKFSLLALLATASLGIVACGKAKFDKQDFKASALAGQYTKPKVDIIVFQDNSSSMITPMQSIKSQLSSFVNGLESRWDYHFVVLPLEQMGNLTYYPLTSKRILASDCSSISSPYCLTTSQKDIFNNDTSDASWMNSYNAAIGSNDVAFKAMTNNLTQGELISTGFLRSDAALAIVTITNGEDLTIFDNTLGFTSGSANAYNHGAAVVNHCFVDPTGFYTDPNCQGYGLLNYSMPAYANAASMFQNFLTNYKDPLSTKKFYAVAAASTTSNCYGSGALQGRRYIDLALNMGGAWYDFCNSSALSGVMNNIRYDLDTLIESYIFNYVVLDAQPIESSIKLYKNGVEIPKSATNGWSYVGYQVNYPTVRWPQSGSNRTGYFIKMNGSYEYRGTDQISIDYQRQ